MTVTLFTQCRYVSLLYGRALKAKSKLVFIIATLASLTISLTLQQQVVASTQYSIIIINNSSKLLDHIFQRPPELTIHGTYDHTSPSHPDLHINANFDDSTHSDPNLHIHIDDITPR